MDRSELGSALDALVRDGGRLAVVRGACSSVAVAEWVEGVSGFDLVLRADVDLYREGQRSNLPDMAALVADLIASVSPGVEVPKGFGDRVRLFRSLTSDRRTLLFLENASEPAQVVATYLDGPGLNVVSTRLPFLGELRFDKAVFFDVICGWLAPCTTTCASRGLAGPPPC